MNSLAYSNNNSRTLTFPKEVLSFCKENDLIHNNSLSISVTTLRQAGIISDNNIKMGDLNQSEDLSQVIDGANTIGNTESCTVTPPINSHNVAYNDILDNAIDYHTQNLLKHVPDNHIIKRLALEIVKVSKLPESSVFMVGLGAFSGKAMLKYGVSYENGELIPIGIYIVVEQPSGTSKSFALTMYQNPFRNIILKQARIVEAEIDRLEAIKKPPESQQLVLDNSKEYKNKLMAIMPLTNSTPEGIEKSLPHANGFFTAESSEQGLFNSLLGFSYLGPKKANNNDILLNGFDGGIVKSSRITRNAYIGGVYGAVILFAQNGSIDNVLAASNGTGLSERFLMLSEPHNLGKRDHMSQLSVDSAVIAEYANRCNFILADIENIANFDNLQKLTIRPEDWIKIREFQNKVEPHLIDGGQFSHIALRGAAGKIRQQIMKISANLHVASGSNDDLIDSVYVESAIQIVRELLLGLAQLCNVKGLIGNKAEFDAILKMFLDKSFTYKQTERQIIQSRSGVEPFKSSTGNKSEMIRLALSELVKQNVLVITEGAYMLVR
jgi:hypothetical protein